MAFETEVPETAKGAVSNSRRLLLAAAWCGPIYALVFLIGFVPLADFLPPPPPSDSAEEIARRYSEHRDSIRAGIVVMMLSLPFAAVWGCALASQVRRTERGSFPFITAFQLVSIAIFTLTLVIIVMFWAAAAFRPGDVSPETTQTLNDMAWLWFLLDWTPFAFWVLSFAVAIFRDRSDVPVYPRWAAYYSLWIVSLGVPGGLIIFFKEGAFAYDGELAFWLPTVGFFLWMAVMSVLTFRAIGRDDSLTG